MSGEIRHCEVCSYRHPRSDYSKSQWKKGDGDSKCKSCAQGSGHDCSVCDHGADYSVDSESDVDSSSDEDDDEDVTEVYREDFTRAKTGSQASAYSKMQADESGEGPTGDRASLENSVYNWSLCDGCTRIKTRLRERDYAVEDMEIQEYIEGNAACGYMPPLQDGVPWANRDDATHFTTYRRSYVDPATLQDLHNKIVYPVTFLSSSRSKLQADKFNGSFFIFKLRRDRPETYRWVADVVCEEYEEEDEVLVGLNSKFRLKLNKTKKGTRVYLTQL